MERRPLWGSVLGFTDSLMEEFLKGVGCPAYALLSYGVVNRCQGVKVKTLKPQSLQFQIFMRDAQSVGG